MGGAVLAIASAPSSSMIIGPGVTGKRAGCPGEMMMY